MISRLEYYIAITEIDKYTVVILDHIHILRNIH